MAISSYWQNHINAWQNSRLSQAAYCRQHNLKYNKVGVLYYLKSLFNAPNCFDASASMRSGTQNIVLPFQMPTVRTFPAQA